MTPVDMLKKQITSPKKDASLAAIGSYIGAMLLFLLGVRKIAALSLTEAQLFIAVLMLTCATMQMVALGALSQLLGTHAAAKKINGQDPPDKN